MLGDLGRMGLLAALSYPLSLVNQVVISRHFGTSQELDAYWVGFFALMFLCAPLLAAREGFARDVSAGARQEGAEAARIFSAHFNTLLVFCAAVCLGCWLLAEPLAGLLTDDPHTRRSLAELLPALAAGVVLLQLNESLTAALTANGRPVCGQYGRLLGAGTSILAVAWLGASLGTICLALALQIANAAFLAVQLAALRQMGLRYTPWCRPSGWLPLGMLAAPMLCHLVLSQGANVTVRLALQAMGPQLVSSYQYALSLYGIPENIILLSIHGAFWALLGSSPTGDPDEVRRVWSILRVVAVLMAGTTAVLWTLSEPISRLLFLRGSFTQQSLASSAQALSLLSLGLVPQALSLLYGRFLLLRRGLHVAGVGWSIQAAVGIAVAWAGSSLECIPLVLLQGAIGGVAAMTYFGAASRDLISAGEVAPGRFIRLAALLACVVASGAGVNLARYATPWQWLLLVGLCSGGMLLFCGACFAAGAATYEDARTMWQALVRARRTPDRAARAT